VGGSALGGGIQNNGGTLSLIDNRVADNAALGGSGGSGFRGGLGAGGGLDDSTKPGLRKVSAASVLDSVFAGNEAVGGRGGSRANGGNGVGGGIAVGSYGLLCAPCKGIWNPRVEVPTGDARPSRKHLGRSRR
jgi:fibronectin-binding autotransporter adhesin